MKKQIRFLIVLISLFLYQVSFSQNNSSNNTIIGDCENESATKLFTSWYSFAAGQSTISPLTSSTQLFTMTAEGANSTENAAVVSGKLVGPSTPTYESCGIGFSFSNESEVVYDLTGATGISFYHKGESVSFSVLNSVTKQDSGHDFNFTVPAHTNWTLVEVPFSSLAQEFWVPAQTTWDPSKVIGLRWTVKNGVSRNFVFGIDEVSVIGATLQLPLKPTVDKSNLELIISKATSIYDSAIEGNLVGQYSALAKSELLLAINSAKNIFDNTNSIQSKIDISTNQLNTAIVTFQNQMISDNKIILKTTILQAQELQAQAIIGTELGQYPINAVNALKVEINNATMIFNTIAVTQTEIDAATISLQIAISQFQSTQITILAGGNTLIADCENESATKLFTNWYSFQTGLSTISPLTTSTQLFTMTAGGANSTENAAVVSGKLEVPGSPSYEWCGIGFSLSNHSPLLNSTNMVLNETEVVYDLSGATGISFYHKGESVSFSVISSVTKQDYGYDFNFTVPSHSNWTLVEVPFSSLAQEFWVPAQTTWDPSKVIGLRWTVKNGVSRNFVFGIDEVNVIGGTLQLPSNSIVNKSNLELIISKANAIHQSAVVGNIVGQYPPMAKTDFFIAIKSAESTLQSTTSSQNIIDNSVYQLNQAIEKFQSQMISDNKNTLKNTLLKAQELQAQAIIGTELGQYPITAMNTFQADIIAADVVLNSIEVTQSQIDAATISLENAITQFQSTQIQIISGGNTIIADCENESATKLFTSWYSFAAGQSTISPLTSSTVPFIMTALGASNTKNAAVVSGNLVGPSAPTYESCGIGFPFSNYSEVVYDLTGATGISFYHKGESITFSVLNSVTKQDAGHDFNFTVPAHTNWTLVEVPFSSLTQESWVAPQATWDASKVIGLRWMVKNGVSRTFSFGIDEVTVMGATLQLPDSSNFLSNDFELLQKTIFEANAILSSHDTLIKSNPGYQEYPLESANALREAITLAQSVLTNADETEIISAKSILKVEIIAFYNSVVMDIPINTISISPFNITLYETESRQAHVFVLPIEASKNQLLWTTSDSSIAIVNNGIITAVKKGVVIISASSKYNNSISASAIVTVINKGQDSTILEISQKEIVCNKNSMQQSITIKSNEIWNASTSDSWISISTLQGIGTESLQFTISENSNVNSRIGYIIISSNGIDNQTITISQAGSQLQEITVSSGNLSKIFNNQDVTLVTGLKLTGTIDIRDIIFIRNSFTNLEVLNLSNVTITEYAGDIDPNLLKEFIVFDKNVLPDNSFKNCHSLVEIYLPKSVTKIGDEVFSGCENLSIIGIQSNPESLQVSETSFDGVNTANCKLIVPIGTESTYTESAVWKSFASIEESNEMIIETDISDISQFSIHLFPNPTIQSFQIQGIEGSAKIVISDMFGRIAETKTITENESISVSNLASGLYNVQVISEQGIQQLQLIKK